MHFLQIFPAVLLFSARVLMNISNNSELFTEAGGISHELLICLCWYLFLQICQAILDLQMDALH